nr:MAG TPA: MHC CLASS II TRANSCRIPTION FACTOR HELIX, MHC CLASS II.5A [Caudoviricetes sp.]
MENFMMNVMDDIIEMSYQRFKLTRRLSKAGIILGIGCFIYTAIAGILYGGEIDPMAPEISPYIASWSGAQTFAAIIIELIALVSLMTYFAMNHGENNHDRYKAWCEENGYKPFNASKH